MEKNVLITGANRGIGWAMVEKFARAGYNVWACARSKNESFEKKLKALEAEYKIWIQPVYFDLSSSASIKEGFKTIYHSKKSIDVLVNNAGIGHSELFLLSSEAKMREVFEINVFAVMELTQLVLKVMTRTKSGSIINLSSIGGIDAYPAHCIYGASKAAIIGFTRSLSAEFASLGIRANVIAPGATDTDMISIFDAKSGGNLLKNAAMKRMAKPEEIANVAVFLASEEASFVNGQVIRVDGGSI